MSVTQLEITVRVTHDDPVAILEAGRFSVFEATGSDRAAELFTRLCEDPELETHDLGFPWTGIRRRAAVAKARGEGAT